MKVKTTIFITLLVKMRSLTNTAIQVMALHCVQTTLCAINTLPQLTHDFYSTFIDDNKRQRK